MLVFLALGLLIYLGYILRKELLVVYVSVLVAIMLTPIVETICRIHIGRWRPSRGAGVLILGVIIAGIAALFGFLALPPILQDTAQIEKAWPERLRQLSHALQHIPFGSHINADDLQRSLKDMVGGHFGMKQIGHDVVAVLIMLLLAAYFILDGPRAFAWLISLFPPEDQPRARATLTRGGRNMQRWLAGQALLMLIHGSSATVAFAILKVRYFYALGIFAGLINIIPVLGPIITLVVAGLVAAIDSITKLIGVIIFYLLYHNVENAFLTPKIMESKVHIPAVTVVVALVIGNGLAGLVGMLVAVPTAVLISVLIREYVASRPAEGHVPRKAA